MMPSQERAIELARNLIKLHEAGNLDEKTAHDLAKICAKYVENQNESDSSGRITMSSGCSSEGKPFVHYVWEFDQKKIQWSPEEAREHAMYLLHCANAAESDSAVFKFFKEELKMSFTQAGQILAMLRNHRNNDDA